jgi:pimeloyl-ACP methyl ester carboxylesterase
LNDLNQISASVNVIREADVVFVHGLGGDAFKTWRHGDDEQTSWPHWLAKEFPNVGVWSLEYSASPLKAFWILRFFGKRYRDAGYSMPLPDRALQVLDRMVQLGIGQRPLLFICHSLGGLVVKQILRKADDAADRDPRKKQLVENTRAVLFLATPHTGAPLASLIKRFRTVFGTTVSVEDLRAHDAHLRDLYNWYRNRSAALGIATSTYYEMRGVKGLLTIVDQSSAHPGVGEDPVPLDEDHLSIAKPRDSRAQVCDAARNLLKTIVIKSPKPLAAEAVDLNRLLAVMKQNGNKPLELNPHLYALLAALLDEHTRVVDENETSKIRDIESLDRSPE